MEGPEARTRSYCALGGYEEFADGVECVDVDDTLKTNQNGWKGLVMLSCLPCCPVEPGIQVRISSRGWRSS